MWRTVLAALALGALPGAAAAACQGVRAEDAAACYSEKVAVIDAELDRVWQAARAKIDARGGAEGQALAHHALEAQRAWEEYRFNDCADGVRAELGGRMAEAAVRGECMILTAKQRVRQLVWRYRLPRELAPISYNKAPL